MGRVKYMLFLLFCLIPFTNFAQYDFLIKNGRILDGTGNPWYKADIAIKNDRIVAIGSLEGTNLERRGGASRIQFRYFSADKSVKAAIIQGNPTNVLAGQVLLSN